MKTAPEARKRIFLSYGHDEHAEFANRLKDDLTACGHTVWIDHERLVPGTPAFDHAIEQGLAWLAEAPDQSCLVFLVTPHSARRPDGFCLNELSRALDKHLRIVPVMVVWCELPLSIARYQWLDMRDSIPLAEREERYQAGLARLRQALEHGRLDEEGGRSRLLALLGDDLTRADAEIERHLAGFEGRQWLKDHVDAWLRDENAQKLYWLTGRPGSGKTAFASWLCRKRREVGGVFLCSWDNVFRSNPRTCVLSLACQLGTQLPDYHDRLAALDLEKILAEADASTLFESLILEPLSSNFPRPDRNVVLCIDALDEATQNGRNDLANMLAQGLEKAPPWLKVFLTSRPEQEVLHPLQGFSHVSMDTFEGENRADLRDYLARHLRAFNRDEPVADQVLETILDRSEGIFLYVRCVLDELRQDRLSLDDVQAFPQGLGGYYARFFARQFPLDGAGNAPEAYKAVARPLLEVMAAARVPLALDHAGRLLGWDEYETEENPGMFGALVLVEGGVLRPCHRTLLEWLADRDKAGKYLVLAKKGHERLADAGWAAFQRGAGDMDAYARDHLAEHLVATGRWRELKTFLSHPVMIARMTADARVYDLVALWLTIGDNLDMAATYRQAVEACEQDGMPGEELAGVCGSVSTLLWRSGNYEEARYHSEKSLTLSEATLGSDHLDVATGLNNLAMLLYAQGDYQGAEPLYRRALLIWENSLGPEHPHVAINLSNLAMLLKAQGDYPGAEPLYRRALHIMEKALGLDHPHVATSLNNLAELLRVQGDFQGAEPLSRRALHIREKTLGPEHPHVAQILNNLALLLYAQGDFQGAEPLFRRALHIWEKALGPKHPDVANSLNNLAGLLYAQGDYQGAEPLFRRSLQIWEKALGPDHPDVAQSLNNLATLLHSQGDFQSAEPLYRRALHIREKTLGPDNPDVAQSLNNLASLLQALGDFQGAEPLYRRALHIREKTLGPEHPDVANSLNNLAMVLKAQGDYPGAEPLFRRSLQIWEKALGPDHPDVAQSLNNLAELLRVQGDFPARSSSTDGLWKSGRKPWGRTTRMSHKA
ncbi:hypothetical protein JCM15519_15410 [Fundidesulfovibrio butyratiphilus]